MTLSMPPSTAIEAALHYAALGYRVFPCAPGCKTPAGDLAPHGCKDATLDPEIITRWWTARPTCNIGISTVGLVVFDDDRAAHGLAAWDGLDAYCDVAAVPQSRTPRGGRHYWFRDPDGRCGNSVSVIDDHVDTRAGGGYCVASPSGTKAGAYEWIVELPPIDQLDVVPEHYARAMERQRGGRAVEAVPVASPPGDDSIPEGRRNAYLMSMAGRLRRIGHSQVEIVALLRAANDTRCRPPLGDHEVVAIATSAGRYEPAPEATAPAELVEVPPAEARGGVPVLSPQYLDAPGFIGYMADWLKRTAHCRFTHHPYLAAITTLASIVGRRVRGAGDVHPNLYAIALAPAGSGKEHLRASMVALLGASAIPDTPRSEVLGADELQSAAGLHAVLKERPSALFCIDEIGRMLATMQDARGNSVRNGIVTALLSAYESPRGSIRTGGRRDLSSSFTIYHPYVCVFGTATPSTFWGPMRGHEIGEGLLSRLMLVEEGAGERQDPEDFELPGTLVGFARSWLRLGESATANIAWVSRPQFVLAVEAPAARQLLGAFMRRCDALRDEGGTWAPVWARTYHKARKLALLYAISGAGIASHDMTITVDARAADWGIAWAQWTTETLIYSAQRHLFENRTAETLARVEALIEATPGITGTDLCRTLRGLSAADRQAALDHLEEAELIRIDLVGKSPNGRQAKRYYSLRAKRNESAPGTDTVPF